MFQDGLPKNNSEKKKRKKNPTIYFHLQGSWIEDEIIRKKNSHYT